jgi:hypothetical protein
MRRSELQGEIQDLEELRRGLLLRRRERLDEFNGWRRFGRGCAEERRQRLRFVARLDLLHIVEVGRVEKLRAIPG